MRKPIAGYASPHSDRLQDPKCDSNDNHHIQNRFDAAEAEDASDPTKRICRSRGGASSARKIVDPPATRAHQRCLEHDVKTEVTLAHQFRQVTRRDRARVASGKVIPITMDTRESAHTKVQTAPERKRILRELLNMTETWTVAQWLLYREMLTGEYLDARPKNGTLRMR